MCVGTGLPQGDGWWREIRWGITWTDCKMVPKGKDKNVSCGTGAVFKHWGQSSRSGESVTMCQDAVLGWPIWAFHTKSLGDDRYFMGNRHYWLSKGHSAANEISSWSCPNVCVQSRTKPSVHLTGINSWSCDMHHCLNCGHQQRMWSIWYFLVLPVQRWCLYVCLSDLACFSGH